MSLPLSYLYRIRQGVEPFKFSTCGCLHPQLQHFTDSFGKSLDIYTDCGHCIRCLDNLRDQFASRVVLHSLDYEYVYFITLTYCSFDVSKYPTHPFTKIYREGFPVLDDENSFHAPRWTPSVLVKSHAQKFLKRLRKQGHSFTYCMCGEYGSKYGRPHFHALLFSHSPISRDSIEDAWSMQLVRHSDSSLTLYRGQELSKTDKLFRFRFGSVDYNDMKGNGSCNMTYDDNTPKQKDLIYSATYVAKYIAKSRDFNMPPRTARTFFGLPFYVDDVDEDMRKDTEKNRIITINSIHYENITLADYSKIISPFLLYSKQECIGKSYYFQRKRDFEAGNYALPKFRGKQLSFPRYYSYLMAKDRNSLRFTYKAPSGYSFSKGFIPLLRDLFQEFSENTSIYGMSLIATESWCKNHFSGDVLRGLHFTGANTSSIRIADFIDSFCSTDSTCTIRYKYNVRDDVFDTYTFDRSTRNYVYSGSLHRIEFCDMVLDWFENEELHSQQVQKIMPDLFALNDAIEKDDRSCLERSNFVKMRESNSRKYIQNNYTF